MLWRRRPIHERLKAYLKLDFDRIDQIQVARGDSWTDSPKEMKFMHRRLGALLNVLGVAVIAVACGPTDTSINAKVKENLATDQIVKAAPIDVGVEKKVVTLSGTVDTATVKERAAAVARATDGVTSVVDRITIKGQDSAPGHGGEMMEKGMMEGWQPGRDGKRE